MTNLFQLLLLEKQFCNSLPLLQGKCLLQHHSLHPATHPPTPLPHTARALLPNLRLLLQCLPHLHAATPSTLSATPPSTVPVSSSPASVLSVQDVGTQMCPVFKFDMRFPILDNIDCVCHIVTLHQYNTFPSGGNMTGGNLLHNHDGHDVMPMKMMMSMTMMM